MKVFDIVTFFNETDLLEIRMHELKDIVDHFLIFDCKEAFNGQRREPISFQEILPRIPSEVKSSEENRFYHVTFEYLLPAYSDDRKTRKLRETYQREQAYQIFKSLNLNENDVIIFSDIDEIPRASSVKQYIDENLQGIYRFKQNQYYYNVNTLTDYGHDWGSRARIGRYSDLVQSGGFENFRMSRKNTDQFVLENAGWHFSYFGGVEKIQEKVAAISPGLSEYKFFGVEQLEKDIQEGRDLHHRRCELPEKFEIIPTLDNLPKHFLDNQDKFKHLIRSDFR